MIKIKIILNLFLLCLMFSCETKESKKVITVSNTTELDWSRETITIPSSEISVLVETASDIKDLVIQDLSSGEYQLIQWIDYDQDSVFDELIFQVDLGPNEEKKYTITYQENGIDKQPKPALTTYSRLVPERTDDYTWENDKVAFRTFGPEAQRLIEANEPGGTLTSGIDLWLKKVEYSIIDSWYAENVKEPGFYHIDHGEGYDPYHVGTSRGTGGLGVWKDDSLLTSKNFVSYKTIATGPIRTVFELEYDLWSEFAINETKRISLDLGSNFSKIEVSLSSENQDPNYALGITLHDAQGETNEYLQQGLFSYWEAIHENFLGTGIVISPEDVKESFVNKSNTPDQSHLLILVKPKSQLTYFVGFGWTGSEQVADQEEWNSLLIRKAESLASPLKVSIQ